MTPGGSRDTGNYFLGADFNASPPTDLTQFATGQLSAARRQTTLTLTVGQNQLMEVILAAAAPSSATVEMDIFDAAGNLVFVLRSTAGEPAGTGHVYLTAGAYTVRFSGPPPAGSPTPPVTFTWTGRSISDPIGPRADHAAPTTTMPIASPSPGSKGAATTATGSYNEAYFS